MSPLFNILNNNIPAQNNYSQMNNNFMGNMLNMINQFNNFKKNFQGDPEQQVKQLLSSGQMTQQQFNQLSQMAKQLQNFLK